MPVLRDSSTLKEVYGEKMTFLSNKALVLEQGHMLHGQKVSGHVFTVLSWYEVKAFLLDLVWSRFL